MTIHEHAAEGDLDGVTRAIASGSSIDAFDPAGLTPLMVAAGSKQVTVATLRGLIQLGADVNALAQVIPPPQVDQQTLATMTEMGLDTTPWTSPPKPASVNSVLAHAVKHASIPKIKVLLEAGADASYVDPCGYSILLKAVFRDVSDAPAEGRELVSLLLAAGASPDTESAYGESPLSVASHIGEFALIRLLLDSGADPRPLEWNPLFFAVAYGTLESVRELAADRRFLDQRDRWERTPFLLAVQAGAVEKATALLDAGAELTVTGQCGHTVLMHAIDSREPAMVRWLIERGVDIEQADEFGIFPLLQACSSGAVACVRTLLAAGAVVGRRDNFDQGVMSAAATPEIIELLSQAGLSLNEVDHERRKVLFGHADETLANSVLVQHSQHKHRAFGTGNPQRMNNPFWEAMIRARCNAYAVSVALNERTICREPFWCFDRFGCSLTKLPDGRYVEIGGEHEDYYDPDFCIYNDVVVHHGDGTFDIYGYPEETFPPTDFHTATLVGGQIYIIGSLGYVEQRQPCDTPVYRLNLQSFAIERVTCHGENPGWIHRHSARLCDGEIEVSGGKLQQGDELVANAATHRLNPATGTWRRVS